MSIDLTTVIAGGIVGTIIGAMNAVTSFILIRYLGRFLDRAEKQLANDVKRANRRQGGE